MIVAFFTRTLSGREWGEERVLYRRCRTQTIDAGTPIYAPIISFVAVFIVGLVNPQCPNRRVAKALTDIAPNYGVHGEGVHKQHETAYEEPGSQQHGVNIHAVDSPW